jgi:hypothetical protein
MGIELGGGSEAGDSRKKEIDQRTPILQAGRSFKVSILHSLFKKSLGPTVLSSREQSELDRTRTEVANDSAKTAELGAERTALEKDSKPAE